MLEARIAWFENISSIYITKKFGGLVVECWKLGLLGLKISVLYISLKSLVV